MHELAGAAQIIKSYEFLQREYQAENEALKEVYSFAEELCKVDDFEAFLASKTRLLKAIVRYKVSRQARLVNDVGLVTA